MPVGSPATSDDRCGDRFTIAASQEIQRAVGCTRKLQAVALAGVAKMRANLGSIQLTQVADPVCRGKVSVVLNE